MFNNYRHDKNDASNMCEFDIENVDISIINGIRRVLLTEIMIPGIIGEVEPTVEIIKNIGGLHNEIMTHRIGLIPICLTEDQIDNYEDNSMVLELNVKNNGIGTMNVDTGHIKGTLDGKELSNVQLSTIFPKNSVSNSHILITRLRTNEELHFKAKVVKQNARFNAAFSPVSLANFFYIEDESLFTKDMNVLDKARSFHKNKYGEATKIHFQIEPINPHVSSKFLINKSLDIISQKLQTFSNNITSGNTDKVIIAKCDNMDNTFQFIVQDEDDTLGNIIQSIIHDKYIRNKNTNSDLTCSYIGYICPHPLKAEMVLKLTLDNQTDINKFILFLSNNCNGIVDEISIIKNEWNKFIDNK
jgi:DNA-directed RNA polymerase subunit L